MIELRSVSKTYGAGNAAVRALRGVSLDVPTGQFVSIMGPSGSGKSTLLNLLGALDVPDEGSITIGGQSIGALDDDALTDFRRRSVGLVFQFFNLLPTLTALDNVLLPVMLERTPTKADNERAARLLDQVGMLDRQQHFIHQLSGGQMQRVAIARALVMRPQLLLADEPTGNLDSQTGASILQLLRSVCTEAKTTIIMVTHDGNASEAGDRVLWLRDGCISDDRLINATAAE
ncbi:MAG TPA: ABC transporter ATP-binding protein [Polyangiales bacterium]|nr:ABC transporter ATP-binding protein [Polyangiales bacterium]